MLVRAIASFSSSLHRRYEKFRRLIIIFCGMCPPLETGARIPSFVMKVVLFNVSNHGNAFLDMAPLIFIFCVMHRLLIARNRVVFSERQWRV